MYRRGSITVFMSLSLMIIASLCFTLLEVSRYFGLRASAKEATEIAADSACSEYLKPMYEQYKVLGVDYSRGAGGSSTTCFCDRVLELSDKTIVCDHDYYDLFPESFELQEYVVMTDYFGAPWIKAANASYKSGIAKEIKSKETIREALSQDGKNNVDLDEAIEAGSKALKNPKSCKSSSTSDDEEDYSKVKRISNPPDVIEKFKDFKSDGVLSMVIEDEEAISDACIDNSNTVSKRNLKSGNSKKRLKVSAAEKILFTKYIQSNYSSYENQIKSSGLRYEQEYIIAGKDNDKDNLEAVVSKLLAAREASNMAVILSSPSKMAEVTELAVSLAGFTANAAVIETVKYGLVASWAYMESVLDVRLLLKGGKVATVKTESDWTSGLLTMAEYFPVSVVAKESATGFSYEDYLYGGLNCMTSKELAYKSMDIVEANLRQEKYYEDICLDHVLADYEGCITYDASPMFFSFVTVKNNFLDTYEIQVETSRSFY